MKGTDGPDLLGRTWMDARLLAHLHEKYRYRWPGQWVGVHRGELVGPASDAGAVIRLLHDRFGDLTAATFTMLPSPAADSPAPPGRLER